VNIIICDVPGTRNLFKDLHNRDFDTSDGAVAVCALDVDDSFTRLEHDYLGKLKKNNENCKIVIAINKYDQINERNNRRQFNEEITRFNNNNNNRYRVFKTSAATGKNVSKLMDHLVVEILVGYVHKKKDEKSKQDLQIFLMMVPWICLFIIFIIAAIVEESKKKRMKDATIIICILKKID